MARPKDAQKTALIEKLGVSTNKNWTKEELLKLEKRAAEKAAKDEEKKALTKIIAGEVPAVPPQHLEIPFDLRGQEDPFSGLTERQKRIARLRMRGLSQQAIANLEGIAQPIISKELKRIKEWQAARGANVDQNAVVGSTSTLYEEVEQMAWQMYYTPDISVSEKAKCLSVVMAAREKHTNLLMDLGLVRKAGTEVKVTHELSPFLQRWKPKDKKELADSVITSQLRSLPEPTPEVDDAEYEDSPDDPEEQEEEDSLPEEEESDDLELVQISELEEPTPDEELEIDDD